VTAEPPRWSPRLRSEWLNLHLREFHRTHNDLTRERHFPTPEERKTSWRREVVAV
jgi:hypothetical protein